MRNTVFGGRRPHSLLQLKKYFGRAIRLSVPRKKSTFKDCYSQHHIANEGKHIFHQEVIFYGFALRKGII